MPRPHALGHRAVRVDRSVHQRCDGGDVEPRPYGLDRHETRGLLQLGRVGQRLLEACGVGAVGRAGPRRRAAAGQRDREVGARGQRGDGLGRLRGLLERLGPADARGASARVPATRAPAPPRSTRPATSAAVPPSTSTSTTTTSASTSGTKRSSGARASRSASQAGTPAGRAASATSSTETPPAGRGPGRRGGRPAVRELGHERAGRSRRGKAGRPRRRARRAQRAASRCREHRLGQRALAHPRGDGQVTVAHAGVQRRGDRERASRSEA